MGKATRATQTGAAEMYPYNQTQRVLKKPWIFARSARRAQQMAAATKMIKKMNIKKRKGNQVETSPHLWPSSLLVLVLVIVVIGTYSVQQIPPAPHQIPQTPLPRAPRQISSFYSTLG
jgi:hypothetical protein